MSTDHDDHDDEDDHQTSPGGPARRPPHPIWVGGGRRNPGTHPIWGGDVGTLDPGSYIRHRAFSTKWSAPKLMQPCSLEV